MKKLIALAFVMLLTGCATSTANYHYPQNHIVENTKTVNKSFDEVWNGLVKELSSDFFVINNIDKSSKIINVSFSASKASNYVDCGNSHRTFKNMQGERVYEYNTADSQNFTTQEGHINRSTRLDGRVNIYVSQEDGKTTVSVNAKYTIPVTLVFQPFANHFPQSKSMVYDFSTKSNYSGEGVICVANGALEKRILNLVK